MEYQYTYNDDVYTILLDPQPNGTFLAQIGETSYEVEIQRQYSGEIVLLINGKPLRAYHATKSATANLPDMNYVNLAGVQTYELAKHERTARRRSTSGGGGSLTAQMPGQVMQVLVAEGEVVEKGQTLMLMEAMKMEIRVAAPFDGTVVRILVEQGATVDRGQQLVEIESA